MNQKLIKEYAKTIIEIGINLQKQQPLLISAPVTASEFVKYLVEYAYQNGASKVIVEYQDQVIEQLAYEHQDLKNFQIIEKYLIEKSNYLIDNNYGLLKISNQDNLELSKKANDKLFTKIKTKYKYLKRENDALMNDEMVWCVVSLPDERWAKLVFPNLKPDEALKSLWEQFFEILRLKNSNKLLKNLKKLESNREQLNNYQFDSLIFRNKFGTNLEIKLAKYHLWQGGSSINPLTKQKFVANLPTEEVYTANEKYGINGILVASKVLNYHGQLIDNIILEFKNGEVINFKASKNQHLLKKIINTDSGAKYAGEIALVDKKSLIFQSNLLFYNTLFDENVSCHLALGEAYPVCASKEKEKLNQSAIHVDIMFGSDDLEITGLVDNQKVSVFKNGVFTL